MVRKLLIYPSLCFLFMVAMVFVLIFSALSREPEVLHTEGFNTDSYERADTITRHLIDAFSQDQMNHLVITGPDIRDLAFYTVNKVRVGNRKLFGIAGVESRFQQKELELQLSIETLFYKSHFLNIKLLIEEEKQQPRLRSVHFGTTKVSGGLITGIYQVLILPLLPESSRDFLTAITGSLKGFMIAHDRMTLEYLTDNDLRSKLKSGASALMLGSAEEKAILEMYLSVFAAAAAQQSGTDLHLAPILRVLVGLAKTRSGQGGSAVKENERMLRAMALQVADRQIRVLLAPGVSPEPLRRKILLRNRSDLTQHFLVSAALALVLDQTTALEIGISKEKSDAKVGGSGFSFPDLLADLAGIRFAVTATESEAGARGLQDYLLANHGEHEFMPEIHWLPQGLTASAYQDLVRHPLYPSMLDRMVNRLNELPLYH